MIICLSFHACLYSHHLNQRSRSPYRCSVYSLPVLEIYSIHYVHYRFSVLAVSIGTNTAFFCPQPIGIFPLHLRRHALAVRVRVKSDDTEKSCETESASLRQPIAAIPYDCIPQVLLPQFT